MTYLHRLAKRIAGLRRAVVLGLVACLACSKGEKIGFLSPDPNPASPSAFSLRVEPLIASVRSGSQVQFSATGYTAAGAIVPVTVDWSAVGGNVGPDGRLTGGTAGQYWVVARIRSQPAIADSARVSVWENEHELVELIVFPDSAFVETDDSIQVMAALRLSNGDLTQQAAVTWSADGGSIDAEGVFTAPVSGSYVVSAVSPTGLRGKATVLVRAKVPQLERISIDPPVSTLLRGETVLFSATAYYNDDTTGPADVAWSATGGSISSTGQYVAGGAPGTYQVIAQDWNGSVADTAQIAISAPTVADLAMSPKTLAIEPGATKQFSALAHMSDDTWQAVPLSWSASGGSISSSGIFTAPALSGSYQVMVNSPGLLVADTASVIVIQPGATMTAIRINPASVSMGGGQSRQFSATADWSDGSSTTPLVTWSATGGPITPGGLYAAGSVAGTYRVIATGASGLADTGTVVVTAPVLTKLTLTPGSASILVGQSVQFAVAGTWSDGGIASPTVVWTVPGGTIGGNRVYTAGSLSGTFAVIATHQAGSLADTSFVTISGPPATLNSLLLAPASGVLAPGAGMDFNVTGTWSNGSSSVPSVTYAATGGTMSGKRYTAGTAPGTYRVIARHNASGKADTSSVVVTSLVTLSSLSVSPEAPSVAPGGSQQFSVSATWSNGSTAVPLVTWTATGGTVSGGGRYTAGATPGTYRVIVAHQGGTRRDTANVTVLGTPPPLPPPPTATLTSLTIAPDPVSLGISSTRQFTLSATWSNGSTTVPPVTWAATGGTISSTGFYAAGALAGSYRVIATQQGGGKADTAAVTITAAAPVLTSLVITPGSASLLAGTSQVFSALGNFSNGTTGPVSVTWAATGGTVSSSGAYTAGATAGSYQVRATLVSGVATATSNVTISVPSTSGCTGGANQPAGFFAIVGRRFNTIGNGTNGRGTGSLPCKTGGSEGWDDAEQKYSNVTLAQDPTAPLSGSNILRLLYPAQSVPSGQTYNPGVVQTMGFVGSTYGLRRYRQLYLRTAFRVSANWQGHPTSTNKLFFVRANDAALPTGGTTRMEPIIRLRGVGAGALSLNVGLQGSLRDKRSQPGICFTCQSLAPNQGVAAADAVTRGQWHILEAVLEIGTNGQANGRLRLWLDGVLTHDYTDIEYEPSAAVRNYWDVLHIAPTWGGQGGTINQTMWLDYDEFFISGAP